MSGGKQTSANKIANTQQDYNTKSAITQQELNQTNQVTPTGSLTYTQTGKNADGTPQYTATSALNSAQQRLLDEQTYANTQGAHSAAGVVNANSDKWASGPDLTAGGLTKTIMGWGNDYLQPVFDRQNAAQDAKLQNQGIMPGTEAWTNAHTDTARNQNDAYTQLLLQGVGQAQSAGEANYLDPLKAVSTLSTGSQPTVQTTQTPQTSVSSTDYTSSANQQNQNNQSKSNALLGGLFKIPTTILGGWASGGL